jgi:hypothetical protein
VGHHIEIEERDPSNCSIKCTEWALHGTVTEEDRGCREPGRRWSLWWWFVLATMIRAWFGKDITAGTKRFEGIGLSLPCRTHLPLDVAVRLWLWWPPFNSVAPRHRPCYHFVLGRVRQPITPQTLPHWAPRLVNSDDSSRRHREFIRVQNSEQP